MSAVPAKRFEDLWIWQEARDLVRHIYADFATGSGARDFGFRDQVRRAGMSVMSNIAEGFERSGQIDRARFFDIARASCGEVRSLYAVADDLTYVTSDRAAAIQAKARRLAAGIRAFAGSLRRK